MTWWQWVLIVAVGWLMLALVVGLCFGRMIRRSYHSDDEIPPQN